MHILHIQVYVTLYCITVNHRARSTKIFVFQVFLFFLFRILCETELPKSIVLDEEEIVLDNVCILGVILKLNGKEEYLKSCFFRVT